MLSQKIEKQNRSIAIVAGIAISILMTMAAYASSGLVQDRRITLEQAQKMLVKFQEANFLREKSGSRLPPFPIVVNDRVLRQLNRYLGTPEGRDFMKAALTRMEVERAPIEKVMQKYGVPRELLAMPIIESGFENLAMNPASKSRREIRSS